MSHPQYQTFQGDQPASPNPPSYSEKELCKDPDPAGSALPTGQGAAVPMPPSYGLPSPAYQPPIIQPQQTVLLTPIYPSVEPDYLAYSIFTMLFCCLPLGIAALIFSIKTRDANHFGNIMAAQRNSKLARNFSHAALGFGIAVLIMNIAILVTLYLLNKP
ncbi:proline-rich transmembrane protein 1-like [Notechis scutatus]|uniref:Proline-rich transmembrane protein 1-like n=1 Tax=Notechis scutatus TaxID=8663 RepID=A0A6J1VLU3_9SAUR|nr:proline-rich transmembrane protein 1-like [Notechis scutatus]